MTILNLDYMNKKDEFIALLKSTNRQGIDDCLLLLEQLGFFTAPASTKFHLNTDGGLVEHSLNVCKVALRIRETMIELDNTLETKLPKESIIIAALLHDVCKSDIYKKTIKRQKNANGQWVDMEGYDVDYSNLPLGHGEKSVIIALQSGLSLTKDEILAIRWHMHAWELPFQSYEAKSCLNVAKENTPLVTLIQTADGLSSSLLEK